MSTVLWVAAIVLVVVGIIGVVVPGIPGTVAVFIGLLLAAWADNFARVGWGTLGMLGVLTALSFGIDFLATSLGAKKVGASRLAIFGAAVGMFAGIFLGFVGLIIGPFVGAFLGELLMRKDVKQAGKAGVATWLGIVVGIAAKIALSFTMIGIFLVAYAL